MNFNGVNLVFNFVVIVIVLLLLLFFGKLSTLSRKLTPIRLTFGKFSDNEVPLKSAVMNVVVAYKFLKLDGLIDSFSVSSIDYSFSSL